MSSKRESLQDSIRVQISKCRIGIDVLEMGDNILRYTEKQWPYAAAPKLMWEEFSDNLIKHPPKTMADLRKVQQEIEGVSECIADSFSKQLVQVRSISDEQVDTQDSQNHTNRPMIAGAAFIGCLLVTLWGVLLWLLC